MPVKQHTKTLNTHTLEIEIRLCSSSFFYLEMEWRLGSLHSMIWNWITF